MSLSAGVPHGVPPLAGVAQAESSKLVWDQLPDGHCVAFQVVFTGMLETLPEANCTTSRPITVAGCCASLFVADSASTLVPACSHGATLIRARSEERRVGK